MKKLRLTIAACFMISLVLLFNSCAKAENSGEPKDIQKTEDVQKTENAKDTQKTEDIAEKKGILEIISDGPELDYEYQLFWSDDVIIGEVIEELDGFYSNPDRKIKECENAWVTPYVVRIEKSYKGLFEEGDTVILDTWNGIGLYPEDYEKYEVITDDNEFYLHEGQRGIFLIQETLYITSADGETMYGIVGEEEGIFEPKETGTASMNEEAKQVYASPSIEITLDQLPGDIQRAEENYKDVDKTYDFDAI